MRSLNPSSSRDMTGLVHSWMYIIWHEGKSFFLFLSMMLIQPRWCTVMASAQQTIVQSCLTTYEATHLPGTLFHLLNSTIERQVFFFLFRKQILWAELWYYSRPVYSTMKKIALMPMLTKSALFVNSTDLNPLFWWNSCPYFSKLRQITRLQILHKARSNPYLLNNTKNELLLCRPGPLPPYKARESTTLWSVAKSRRIIQINQQFLVSFNRYGFYLASCKIWSEGHLPRSKEIASPTFFQGYRWRSMNSLVCLLPCWKAKSHAVFILKYTPSPFYWYNR
jgi:hypothetical protein